jgi:hypothetical protein
MRLSGSRRGPLVSSIAWRFSLRSARLAFCTLLNVVTGGRAWSMAPLLSQLRVEQKIEKENQLYRAQPGLSVPSPLAEPSEVTMTDARHLAGYTSISGCIWRSHFLFGLSGWANCRLAPTR